MSSSSSSLIETCLAESGEFIFTCSLDSTHWSEMKQVNKDFNNWRPSGEEVSKEYNNFVFADDERQKCIADEENNNNNN